MPTAARRLAKEEKLAAAATPRKVALPATSLVLRTSNADGTSRNGFQWPASGPVECPDWNPVAECGGGLHGLLWGEGDWSLLSSAHDALWQVVEVVTEAIVKIDAQKVKFPRGVVIFSGGMAKAITMVLNHEQHFKDVLAEVQEAAKKAASSGDYSKAASSGDYSTAASSGYYSTAASSGYYSTAASSGYYSTAASSGDSSKAASSGDYSTAASSGNSSTAASSGNYSKAASSGDYSTAASSGNSSTAASSGNYSTAASSGDSSTAASSGYYSTAASSGDSSKAASSGDYSTAASSGNSSTAASSGNYSKAASSGDYSTAASSGNSSTAASSGNYSTAASSGDYSTAASSGYSTIAMAAGTECIVQAGKGGCFASAYYHDTDKRNRILVGYVGEGGIAEDTPYRIVVTAGVASWAVAK